MTFAEFQARAEALQEGQHQEIVAAEARYQEALLTPPAGVAAVYNMDGPARGGEPGNVGERLAAYMYRWRDLAAAKQMQLDEDRIGLKYAKLMSELDDEFDRSSS